MGHRRRAVREIAELAAAKAGSKPFRNADLRYGVFFAPWFGAVPEAGGPTPSPLGIARTADFPVKLTGAGQPARQTFIRKIDRE